jgi:hypothetical protein
VATTAASCASAAPPGARTQDERVEMPGDEPTDSVVLLPDTSAWCGTRQRIVVTLHADDFQGGGLTGAHGSSCGYVVAEKRLTPDGAIVAVRTGAVPGEAVDTIHVRRGRRCRTVLRSGGAVVAFLGSEEGRADREVASCR